MTWPVMRCLAGLPFIITTPLKSEVPTLIAGEQCQAIDLGEVSNESQDAHRPGSHLWLMDEENEPSAYDYRNRSRDTERNRKGGRSRDARGDDAQRSIIRGGAWTESNGIGSDLGEDSDTNISQEKPSSEKTEEGL
jgi:hypothetical protein